MNRNIEDIDDVLVKYLLGEATPEEGALVHEWTNSSEANKKYFDHFRLIWDESKKLEANSSVDENAAWQRFTQRIADDEQTPAQIPVHRRTIPLGMSWMKIAAMLVMLIGCGAIYYFTAGPGSTITTEAGDHTIVANLPDGSTVTLNRNSAVTYPKTFRGNTRHVTLKGEGFFNVTPDKNKPFIIDADNSNIKVVGTSFNVKSNSEKTEVIVETGIVEVAKKQFGIRVLPHEKAIVSRTEDKPVKTANEDELYNYYRTKKFVCNGITLKRLVEILNEAYDTHIAIDNPTIAETKINTTFDEGSLNEILEVIKATYGLKMEQNGSVIILK